MICKICSEPVGLIHNCKPPVASDVGQKSPMQIATKALMMADAGYPIDPVVLVLAQAIFDCRKFTVDMVQSGQLPGNGVDQTAERNGIILLGNAIQRRLDHG